MKTKKLIAVTGGIGSGKTTALFALKNAGYGVVSCDEITKKLYKKHMVKKRIKEMFPTAVKGKIFLSVDKKELSRLVFNDKNKNARLTAFTTELIFNLAIKEAKTKKGKVFVEVPLLFEKGYEKQFDKVIVIKRAKEERVSSVMARSNLTEEEVNKRMQNQIDYDLKDFSAYLVVENAFSKEEFVNKILKIAKEI